MSSSTPRTRREGQVGPGALWSRAALLGSLVLLLGTVGHTSAAGLLPGPGAMLGLLVATIVLVAPALARPASALRIVVLTVLGQTGVHLALTLTAGHAGDAATTAATHGPVAVPGGPALPTVDGHRVGTLAEAWSGTADVAHVAPALPVAHLVADMTAHAPMMLAHTLAAVAVGLWLAVGEKALFTVLALTGRRLVLPVALLRRAAAVAAVLTPCSRTWSAALVVPAPVSGWARSVPVLRGPPSVA
ncbi:hypothetical protein [Nocardioides bruguierae]|uniref:hypothetical protein n=1 Tax=Nocardioides bruguierae TaxID=2945102 RepID=UPI0020203871|nr:hypothetical protein [Nocardioides bruguierae]MCL8024985.1 hypothetical protein [Nocardioides bruguierae]